MLRRHLIAGTAALALAPLMAPLVASMAGAADYPRRPINIVVPYKAGGGTDAYARALSAAAEGVLPVPVVVVNKPGSGGLNGAQSVLGARPDGYTVMLTSGGSFLLTTLMRKTPIDALDSFRFVAQVGQLRTALMVPADSPFQTVQDVIAAAKANPGGLRWAHSGRGGFHHVGGLGFLAANGIKAQDVPFKGGGPARAALIGAQTDFGFIGVQQLRGFEGKIRALAVNAADRDGIMTKVPSFGELGIPFANVSSPVLILAPKDTPDAVVAYLEAALKDITAKHAFADLLAKQGSGPVYADAATARATLAAMKADVTPLVADLK
ncbi:MAG: tripartite tricarboxylate transporter substrate binding protein [Rhodobacterales bacterium]|nr:tripartite tricarboxylate transporter substrate binding protein [Rhodobacterales bacterium]